MSIPPRARAARAGWWPVAVGTALILGGCAHGTLRPVAPVAPGAPYRVRAITVDLAATAPTDRRVAYEHHSGNQLIASAIVEELTAAGAYDAAGGDADLAVHVEQFRLRSTGNAVWNGFFAGIDKLEGNVDLRRDGAAPDRYAFVLSGTEDAYFKFSAEARFRSLARTLGEKIAHAIASPGAADY